MDEEEKLKRQRKLGEEKEAERQEHEEKKFKEKSLKQYQHRLNTAIYAEEDQKIKEDKVLQHEIDLHNKNVTKHILQEQVSFCSFQTTEVIAMIAAMFDLKYCSKTYFHNFVDC